MNRTQTQNLIRSFTSFLNTVHSSLLIQTALTSEEADALLDQVDAYDWYCQNTTSESDADPRSYCSLLIKQQELVLY